MTENLSHIGPCPRSRSPCPIFLTCLAKGLATRANFAPIECISCQSRIYELAIIRENPMETHAILVEELPPCAVEWEPSGTRFHLTRYMCQECRLERERVGHS